MPELSIVIPTLGRSGSLSEVLGGLERQEPPLRDAEVLVVVDPGGSTPPVLGERSSAGSVQISVRHAMRTGASAARNVGLQASDARLILFLDDDIVPSGRLVAQHLAWHRRRPEIEVAVLGVVRWSPRVRVTPFMRWLEMGIMFDYRTIRSTEVRWQRFYSCNVSVKRSFLDGAGGFNEEQFPFGYEDLELGRRLSDRGLRLLYNHEAVGEHLKTETLESWRRNLGRIAVAERRFTELYPGEPAYFLERFRAAAAAPRARGRSARLARYVAPDVPWLGSVVWRSFDRVCSQQLAPEFLARWRAAGP